MERAASSAGSLVLKIAFVLAAAWALLVAFAYRIDSLLAINPAVEGTVFHSFFEVLVVLAIFSAVAFICVITYKRWPMFLRIRRDVSMLSVLWRLIAVVPVTFAVIGLVSFALGRLLVMLTEDAGDPQYGLSAWWAGYYYALMLAPTVTVVWVWLSLRRKYRE